MAQRDNSNNAETQRWKTKFHMSERQLSILQQRSEFLSKQAEETHRENLRLNRVIEDLQNKLQISKSRGDHDHQEEILENDLFFTFPEELWPFILVYVNSSNDLINLGEASPLLESAFLIKEKAMWIFDQIYPKIFKYLEIDEVLTCRLVCRKWNQAVENHLDSYPKPKRSTILPSKNQVLSHNTPVKSSNQSIWKYKLEPLDFDNTPSLARFLTEARSHHPRNILTNRSLKLGIDLDEIDLDNNNDNNNEMINEFWETALNLLRVIGKHIWHIEIYNDGFENEAASFYGLLHRLLCLLPNVKTLRIIGDFENSWNLDIDLTNRLGTWPLPTLPHLECLHVLHCMSSLMTATIAASYTRQIRKFCVSVAILIHIEEEYLRGFLNLIEIILRDCVKDVSEFHVVLRKLEVLEAPNLEKLRLFRSFTSEEVITTDYLFGLMLRFPKLRSVDTHRMDLQVSQPDPGSLLPQQSKNFAVYSIRTLKVRNSIKLSFEFLLKLPCLERLFIRDEEDNRLPSPEDGEIVDDDDVIDVKRYIYRGNIYLSNIWVKIPKLVRLTYDSFDDDVIPSCRCTREMYDHLVKKWMNTSSQAVADFSMQN